MKTQQTPAAPSVNAWLQRLFLIATGLSSIASVQLFALAERTDQYVAWTVAPPLMAAFHDAGCEKYFSYVMTGSKFERKGLEQLLAFMRSGDTVIVWKLDRYILSLPV